MNQILIFLLRHGYSVVFVFVLAEQIGLPVPSTPILLAMGALAGLGLAYLISRSSEFWAGTPISFHVDGFVVAGCCVLAMLSAFVGSLAQARRAVRGMVASYA